MMTVKLDKNIKKYRKTDFDTGPVKDVLRDLSVDPELAQIYVDVCAYGPLNIKQLSTFHSNTGLQKKLDELEKAFLIFSVRSGESITYEATPAKFVTNAIEFETLWNNLPSKEHAKMASSQIVSKIEKITQTCKKAGERLDAFAPMPMPYRRDVYEVTGNDAISGFLSKTLAKSRYIVRTVVAPPWIGKLSIIWASITHIRDKHGVAIDRLSDVGTFMSMGYAINKRDLEDVGIQLHIFSNNPLTVPKIYLVDDTVAIVLDKTRTGEWCRVNEDPSRVDEFKEMFDELKKNSKRGEDLLKEQKSQRKELLNKGSQVLNERELKCYELLLDYGIFCYQPHFKNLYNMDKQETSHLCSTLVNHGLAKKSTKSGNSLGIIPAYTLQIPEWVSVKYPSKESVPQKAVDVLQYVKDHPGINKKSLQTNVGMNWPRFEDIFNQIISKGWIREVPISVKEGKKGPNPKMGYEITILGENILQRLFGV